MKNLFVYFLIIFSLIFSSCEILFSSIMSHAEEQEVLPELYEKDSQYVKCLRDDNRIVLNNVKGKIISFASFNASPRNSLSINAYVTSASGISPLNINSTPSIAAIDYVNNTICLGNSCSNSYLYNSIQPSVSNERAVYFDELPYSEKISDFTIGTTKYNFWIDSEIADSKLTYRSQKVSATLRGMDSSKKFLVWVIDDYYASNSYEQKTATKITSNVAQDIADNFAKIYSPMHSIFGEEADHFVRGNGDYFYDDIKTTHTIKRASPFGDTINIVVYDINSTGEKKGASNTIVGYFSSKDYVYNHQYSNQGKIFYIDSKSCNYNPAATNNANQYLNNTGKVSDSVKLTLAHEFQHMLNFGTKSIAKLNNSPVWENEMLSMLAEELMNKNILSCSEDEEPLSIRIDGISDANSFLYNYYKYSGPGVSSKFDYESAYAFGAWISRSFGGVELIKEMASSNYTGMENVIQSIYKKTGTRYTEYQLYEMFMQACVFRNDFAKANNLPSFNYCNFDSTIQIQFNQLDLFSDKIYSTINGKKIRGPVLYANKIVTKLEPHGFMIHILGKATKDTVELNFSDRQQMERVYIYIQNDFSNIIN